MLDGQSHGLIDNWLRPLRDVYERNAEQLRRIADASERVDRLCELNVVEQVRHVCQTTIVQQAWQSGQALAVHGWIYGLHDGLLRDLNVDVEGPNAERRTLGAERSRVAGMNDEG